MAALTRTRLIHLYLALAVAATLAGELLAPVLGGVPPHRILVPRTPMAASGMAAPFVAFAVFAGRGRERRLATVACLLVSLVLTSWLVARGGDPIASASSSGAVFGVAGVLLLAWGAVRGDAAARALKRHALWVGLVPLLGTSLLAIVFVVLADARPLTLDLTLYAMDGTLLPGAGAWLGRWITELVRGVPAIGNLVALAYVTLPAVVAAAVAADERARLTGDAPVASFDVLAATVLAVWLGGAAYLLAPAVGPKPVFGDAFPSAMPWPESVAIGPVAVPLVFPRNCVPSLHLALAVIAYLSVSARSGRTRAVALAYLAATAVATVVLGEHYVVDLVAALPFTLLVRAVCTPRDAGAGAGSRAWCAALGLALTVGWIVAMHVGVAALRTVDGATGVLSVATLVATWYGHRALSAPRAHGRRVPVDPGARAAA